MVGDNFYEAAMNYLDKGFSVIPTDMKSKLPKVSWTEFQERRPDKELIHLWSESYDSNISIVTGNVSGITVVDIDGESGFESLKSLDIDTDTYTVRTGKGMHLYYRYTPEVKTLVGIQEGIDIRNDGGYVIAPPSIHVTGKRYELQNEGAFKPFPPELIKVYKENYKSKDDIKTREAESALSLSERLKDGARNSLLTSVTGTLKALGFSKEAVVDAVKTENANALSPLSDREVERIIDSVWRYPGTEKFFPLSDVGNKERMENLYRNNIVFNNDMGKWLHYSKNRWEIDYSNGMIQDMTISMIRRIPSEVSHLDDDDDMKEAYRSWARACEAAGKITACIQLTEKAMSVPDERFDRDQFKINLANGTFDLKHSKNSDHNRYDYITKMTPVRHDEDAECPRWEKFLDEIFKGDKELIKFIQRAVGYSLTGATNEQAFFIMYGSGANGKSVFIDTINYLMGDYSKRAEFSTFVSGRTTGAPRNDIAMLKGSRMVSASEGTITTIFDESLIKQLTGDETITARFLYQENFEFSPTFKIWLATNHLPIIRDDSLGIWRRLKCIPFEVSFRGKEDPYLLGKLKEEINGIFNWAVKGYEMWSENGLGTCKKIENATSTYRNDMDIFGAFSEEVLEKESGIRTPTSEIYDAYVIWNKQTGHNQLSKNRFGIKMREHGFNKEKVGGVIYWYNVQIKGKYDEF